MDFANTLWNMLLPSIIQMIIHPLYYVGLLLIAIQYRRQIVLEKKLFSTRLHYLSEETLRSIFWGWGSGILASIIMAFVGVVIQQEAILLVWGISILLLFARIRYLCLSYAVGVLGIAYVVIMLLPDSIHGTWTHVITHIDIPSLLALVAMLHLMESILVFREGSRMAAPQFVASKRGKIIGGFSMQGYWPIPLFLLTPLQNGNVLPWTPLMGQHWSLGWGILAFPVVIGFSDFAASRLPRQRARKSAKILFIYSLTLLILAIMAHYFSAIILVASLASILLHELMIWYSRWEESRRSPLYVHPSKGLKILAVIPESPAAQMGLVTGEVIIKVNGVDISTKEQLYKALQQNSAYCQLQVLNLDGESKFVKRALFAGEHHQLGIILCPDERASVYVEEKQLNILAFLRKKLVGFVDQSSKSEQI